jgi:hypothetical protein
MGNVMTVTCRSYSAQAFDGCPACVDAALEAVSQAGMYVLGRSNPGLFGLGEGPVGMACRMRVRLYDQHGAELAVDEIEAEQTVELVPALDDGPRQTQPSNRRIAPSPSFDPGEVGEVEGADPEEVELESTMRLDDFQTVLDLVKLSPSGPGCMSGSIAGTIFGYDMMVGRFDIELFPAD